MLRLPFSSLPLFSFFLPLTHTYVHTYIHTHRHAHIDTYTHTHTYTTQQSFRLSQTHIHTFASLIIPLRAKRPLDPERYAHPLAPVSGGWATPWKIALLHDTISPGFAIPSYVRCSWEAEKRKEQNCRRSHRFSSVIQISPTHLSFVSSLLANQWNFGTLRPYNLNQFLSSTYRNIVALESSLIHWFACILVVYDRDSSFGILERELFEIIFQ